MNSSLKDKAVQQAMADSQILSQDFKLEANENGSPTQDTLLRFVCSLLSAEGHPFFYEDGLSLAAKNRYFKAILYKTFENKRIAYACDFYWGWAESVVKQLALSSVSLLKLSECKTDGFDIRGIIAKGAEKALDASLSQTLSDLPGQRDLFDSSEEDTASDAVADMIAVSISAEKDWEIQEKLSLLANVICSRDDLESDARKTPNSSFLPEGGAPCHPELLDPRMSPQAREAWARHGGAFLRALFAGDGAQWELFGNPATAGLKKRGRGRPQNPGKG